MHGNPEYCFCVCFENTSKKGKKINLRVSGDMVFFETTVNYLDFFGREFVALSKILGVCIVVELVPTGWF